MASRKKAVLIGAGLAFGLLCLGVGVYLNHTREAEGEAATWEGLEGRDMLRHLREGLPREAKNIWYSCYFYDGYGEATFDISERGFLAWAAKRGWSVKRIAPEDFYAFFLQQPRPKVRIRLKDGYVADGGQGRDFAERARYDRGSGKAYYRVCLP